jgi:chemotaxis protein histidine kinase CheA
MNEFKPDTPGVIKYDDHEVIVPPNRLKKAVKRTGSDRERDPITDAEEALEHLSAQFQEWMDDECAQLDKTRRALRDQGFNDATRQALFRAAHDIKGHGATFGYPMAAEVADTLCRLIEQSKDFARTPMDFIDQFVDAVRAIIREGKTPQAQATATTLANELRAVAKEYLAVHGTNDEAAKPETCPPLAPT